MFSRLTAWMMAALPLWLAGCAARGDVEMLESELRRHELAQEELTAQLQGAQDELRVARADADNLRSQLASRGQAHLVSEQAEVLYKADAVKFNMLMTGGVNRDGQPGDEGLAVLLLPVDAHGDLVKLLGGVELELLDVSREGDDKLLGRWQFSVDEVRERWHRGFMSAGYLFQLDWQVVPQSPSLTLYARMTAPDGRKFDATSQVKVVPPASSAGAASPAIAQPGSAQQPLAPGVARMGYEAPPGQTAAAERGGTARTGQPAAAAIRPPQIVPGPGGNAPRRGHAPLRTSDSFTDMSEPTVR